MSDHTPRLGSRVIIPGDGFEVITVEHARTHAPQLTVEAIQLAQHLRRTAPAKDVILGLLSALDSACDLKDRLVLDCRANKDEADALRNAVRDMMLSLGVGNVEQAKWTGEAILTETR